MEENQINLIKELVSELLKKLSVNFESVETEKTNEKNVRFVVKSDDSGILIGTEGKNIKALNHLIKQIVLKNQQDHDKNIGFYIDINDYQAKNIERIKNKATDMAEKAIVFKRDVEMDPMSSFERMLVHSILADNEKVSTESSGEGMFRKVVIKFNGEKDF